MRKILLASLATLALCFTGYPGVTLAEGTAAVWRVTGDEGSIYLAGSIHVLREDDYPLPGAYQTAWEETDTLYLEIDPAVLADPAAITPFVPLLLDPDGRTLDDLLDRSTSTSEMREIRSLTRALELDLAPLQPFRPWYAALSVMQILLAQNGFDPRWGVDQRMGARAMSEGRPAFGLETLGDQLGILASLSPKQEAQFLLQMLREAEQLDVEVGKLVDAWRSGDQRALAALADASFDEFADLEQQLLADRNARWFATLRPLLDHGGDHLVVVGALHLVGDDGLVGMFEEAGFDVEQL